MEGGNRRDYFRELYNNIIVFYGVIGSFFFLPRPAVDQGSVVHGI